MLYYNIYIYNIYLQPLHVLEEVHVAQLWVVEVQGALPRARAALLCTNILYYIISDIIYHHII